ncbi:MAG: hypothetical protein LBS61_03025 [Endomicrobium sp.]|nr:hypothetical protein [Endomicrobium sp.]
MTIVEEAQAFWTGLSEYHITAAFKKTKKKVIRNQEQETNTVLNENYEVGALRAQLR